MSAQTFAVAEYLGPTKDKNEEGTLIPTATARVLPTPLAESSSRTPPAGPVVVASAVPSEESIPQTAETPAATPTVATATATATATSVVPPTHMQERLARMMGPIIDTADGSNHQATATTTPPHVLQKLARMKRQRQSRQVLAATSGVVVGAVLLGPVSAAVGGVAAHAISKSAGRAREQRIRKQYTTMQSNVQTSIPRQEQAIGYAV
eukprot:CAMPEP_0116831208 /NCGR_PEP_ID=MMETSP0418-20121206/5209_1 /TAXON_ID=1158023 /ORGANISM="Astrosyne radiata, Strain 13vi08-1A" /LENGTH=207 /DNA_ID=CAMNT_0004460433 /DNA_START=201 /DNA_END=824 /DNA_ORIENTATION=+